MGKINRTYSRYTLAALQLFAGLIKSRRIESGITTQELSERAGISRDLLYRIESADPACSIGLVFEVASLLGLQLFSSDMSDLELNNLHIKEKLTLLPSKVKSKIAKVDDDF